MINSCPNRHRNGMLCSAVPSYRWKYRWTDRSAGLSCMPDGEQKVRRRSPLPASFSACGWRAALPPLPDLQVQTASLPYRQFPSPHGPHHPAPLPRILCPRLPRPLLPGLLHRLPPLRRLPLQTPAFLPWPSPPRHPRRQHQLPLPQALRPRRHRPSPPPPSNLHPALAPARLNQQPPPPSSPWMWRTQDQRSTTWQ